MTAETRPLADPVASATRIRWSVLTVATLSSVLLYLDRISANFIVESIRVEFAASQTAMGWYLGAFFWSYALGQVPAGWLSDRFGIRLTLTLYILLWSAFTALLGLSTGLVTLLVWRLGCGLAQAGAYPSCGRAVRDWMPLTQRGMASSIVAFGGRAGGAIAPVLTGAVMLTLALSESSAEFQTGEILDPQRLATRLTAGETADAPVWLQRIWSALDAVHQQELIRIAGTADGNAAASQSLQEVLNGWQPLSILAQAPETGDPGLPPDQARRLAEFQTQASASGDPVLERQFWESAFPEEFRKLESRGWRGTMLIFGISGIIVAGIFWVVFRNQPEQHPWCNAAEVALIGNTPSAGASTPQAEKFPWGPMLRDVGLWGNCLCQFGTNIGWLFLVTWFARYLGEVHRVPVLERGLMVSLPIFAGMFGMLAGGPWTDRLTARLGLKWGRRIPIASSRIVAAGGYLICALATTGMFGELGSRGPAWATVVGLAIVAIATDLGVAATWAYAQDVAGKHTAAILGWANMWGNLGAAVSPPLYNLFLGEKATLFNWNMLFAFCASAFLISAIGGWLMDSSRPLGGKANA